MDHTAETGADIKQDWRRRPGYPWSAWEHQILQAAPLLSCEDSCLARVRSNRARLRVAFTAWREATASAAPDPALARDAEPGDKSDGGPRSAGWGRIANSSEHLAPLPTGQVFVLASLPEAGRPFFSVELGHVGLKIDADLPRRAIEAAVGFLESARSIIESLAHSSDDAGPIPGRVGPRGSELAGESPDEDGAPSGDGDVAEKEAFLSLLQSVSPAARGGVFSPLHTRIAGDPMGPRVAATSPCRALRRPSLPVLLLVGRRSPHHRRPRGPLLARVRLRLVSPCGYAMSPSTCGKLAELNVARRLSTGGGPGPTLVTSIRPRRPPSGAATSPSPSRGTQASG